MHEIKAVERVILVLDAPVEVRATAGAGMALNRRLLVDDLQLVAVGGYGELVATDHRDHREQRPLRLPALGTAAHVIEGRVALESHGHGRGAALAAERTAGEISLAGLHAAVDGRMNRNSHDVLLVRC